MQAATPYPTGYPHSSEQDVTFLVAFGFLPKPPAVNLDKSLYEAVSLVRVALRRQDTPLPELSRCACRLLGVEDVEQVARLATTAEDGCVVARRLLRLNGEG